MCTYVPYVCTYLYVDKLINDEKSTDKPTNYASLSFRLLANIMSISNLSKIDYIKYVLSAHALNFYQENVEIFVFTNILQQIFSILSNIFYLFINNYLIIIKQSFTFP